ncbi:MAG: response regulator transcription factor [Candidatus Marinimicrobia bacterium]|jgi:DNA-binding LytR/AlgR family response regulator|nr:response regulator transcription factor [Candidatus Neomarinimicrobiota bacterium]MBT3575979.1 response regulator transcription factor [Candidatus Neomarinimicrobiota bacterium]MBT3679769.1 response regulator transcription factor [Candidatus Neomarinimicrobiota bacterium]MBT3950442.1 response regulator transcription factor [Candidatus Neomarinimicrobiota bacterium]MBT4253328.1 response regulator transcription factor [Candidatus Neomarinimicrobiota bacterium]
MSSPTNIRCLIVDDEAPARAVIKKYLSDIPGIEVLRECKNAFEANEAILTLEPDLIFLDINMPKFTGLKLLESLRRPPLAIITTAYREYALESFELDVVDYLHKPFSLQRFVQALNKARDRMTTSKVSRDEDPPTQDGASYTGKEFIFLKEEGQVKRVDLRNILYVEAVGDYLSVVTSGGKHLSYMSMKKMVDLLPADRFCRIHKSFIVSLSKVNTIDKGRVYIGKESFPIGATYRPVFMDLIKTHMG